MMGVRYADYPERSTSRSHSRDVGTNAGGQQSYSSISPVTDKSPDVSTRTQKIPPPVKYSILRLFAVLALLLALNQEAASQGPSRPASTPKPDPSFQPIQDVPGLPRVLLIGDSISMGYTVPVRELLEGKANVHRIPANSFTTRHTLAHLKEWVGTGKWDLIHFNCGLHDIVVTPAGDRQVSLADYERNLRELVAALRPVTKQMIWCSTTPTPGVDLTPQRHNEDVVAYNAAARRVMMEHGVPINDLYAFALPQVDTIRKPLNVHYTPKGNKVLARQVAQCIEQALAASSATTSQ